MDAAGLWAEDFRTITEPALVVMGDRDELIAVEQALEMYRLIADAVLVILPNASHTALSHPRRVLTRSSSAIWRRTSISLTSRA